MTELEILALQEALKFAAQGLEKMKSVDNEHVKHLANILHSVVGMGENVLKMINVPV